jgi:hypothetical protein
MLFARDEELLVRSMTGRYHVDELLSIENGYSPNPTSVTPAEQLHHREYYTDRSHALMHLLPDPILTEPRRGDSLVLR